MKQSKIYFILGCILVIVAVVFIIIALNHPEMSFPWSNNLTVAIYAIYLIATFSMFILSVIMKRK